jgi:hypothetical protein
MMYHWVDEPNADALPKHVRSHTSRPAAWAAAMLALALATQCSRQASALDPGGKMAGLSQR